MFTIDGGPSCAYCTCIVVEDRSEVCVQHHLFTVNFHWICQVWHGDMDPYHSVCLHHYLTLIYRCFYRRGSNIIKQNLLPKSKHALEKQMYGKSLLAFCTQLHSMQTPSAL